MSGFGFVSYTSEPTTYTKVSYRGCGHVATSLQNAFFGYFMLQMLASATGTSPPDQQNLQSIGYGLYPQHYSYNTPGIPSLYPGICPHIRYPD